MRPQDAFIPNTSRKFILRAVSVLSERELKVLVVLLMYANSKSRLAWPSTATITKDCGLDARHIRRAIAGLEGHGFVLRHQVPGKIRKVEILDREGGADLAQGGGADLAQGGGADLALRTIEGTKEGTIDPAAADVDKKRNTAHGVQPAQDMGNSANPGTNLEQTAYTPTDMANLFQKKYPLIHALMDSTCSSVANRARETVTRSQTSIIRSAIARFLNEQPASLRARAIVRLEDQAFWANLAEMSHWPSDSKKKAGNAGYGTRMAWSFTNRIKAKLVLSTPEEREQKLNELAASGTNPFLK